MNKVRHVSIVWSFSLTACIPSFLSNPKKEARIIDLQIFMISTKGKNNSLLGQSKSTTITHCSFKDDDAKLDVLSAKSEQILSTF